MKLRNIVQIVTFTLIGAAVSSAYCMDDENRRSPEAILALVSKDSVQTFNTTYTKKQRQDAAVIKQLTTKNAGKIAELVETSEPTRQLWQTYLITGLVGEKPEAITKFKKLPSDIALSKAEKAGQLSAKTKARLSKSDAFLLSPNHRQLSNAILDKAQTKEGNSKRFLFIDDKTYNAIAHLPPATREAVGKDIIAVVGKTREEKLVTIGAYTLSGALSGAIVGGTANCIAKAPMATVTTLAQVAPAIATNATHTFLKEAVTFDPDKFTQLYEKSGPDDNLLQLQANLFKETVTVNSPKDAALSAIDIAKQQTNSAVSAIPPYFSYTNAKDGILPGAACGAFAGFCYGSYKAGQPKKKIEIAKIGKKKTKKRQ